MSADMPLRNNNAFQRNKVQKEKSSFIARAPPPPNPFSLFSTVFDPACVCFQGAAAYPENEDQQQRLREAAEGLRVATNAAAQNAIKKKLINRLEVSEA